MCEGKVMTTETTTIEVVRYRDPEGRPTCALSFNTEEVCKFFRTQKFGTVDTCLFAEQYYKYNESQQRYNDDIYGYMIPLSNCPVWNKNDNSTRVE